MPSPPAAMGIAEKADIAKEWLEPAAEEAAAPLRDRKERDSHPPTAVGRVPPADPRSIDTEGTDTPMMTWTSATAAQPLDRPDPLGVDTRGNPLEEARLVDHPEEDCLDEEEFLEQEPRGCHESPEGAQHHQGVGQVAEHGRQQAALGIGQTGRPRKRQQRFSATGVGLGRQLGARIRSRQTPCHQRSPQEPPQHQCPLEQQCPSERLDAFRT